MIDGNIFGTIQVKTTTKNSIGEAVESWEDVGMVWGWLDYGSGQNDIQKFNAKVQDTSHFFICDCANWKIATKGYVVTSENSRMVIDNDVYNILMIDNPMLLNDHMEIFLKYVGGGQ